MDEQKEIIREEDTLVILEQWKTCIDMANSISRRRDNMNNLFVTLNLALLAAATYSKGIRNVSFARIGIATAVIWRLYINYYRQINSAKYKVIREMEKHLPINAYELEWEIYLDSRTSKMEGYMLDRLLPLVFAAAHIVILLIGLFGGLM